jgi:hypothetical protein
MEEIAHIFTPHKRLSSELSRMRPNGRGDRFGGHFRPSSAGFADRPLPLRPKLRPKRADIPSAPTFMSTRLRRRRVRGSLVEPGSGVAGIVLGDRLLHFVRRRGRGSAAMVGEGVLKGARPPPACGSFQCLVGNRVGEDFFVSLVEGCSGDAGIVHGDSSYSPPTPPRVSRYAAAGQQAKRQ